MELESLYQLYISELKDLYSAERQIVRALPKMMKHAANPSLKRAFSDHLDESEGHVQRLENIFQMLDEKAGGKKCKGMEGLIQEANELLDENISAEVLDAGLISKAQHVEHYEMAGYGTVRTYAEQLGFIDQAQLLQQTLDEEGQANELLTQIAETDVNAEAGDSDDRLTTSRRRDQLTSRPAAPEGRRNGRGDSRSTSRLVRTR